MDDEKIQLNALTYAKEHRNKIAKELTDMNRYSPDARPVSIFMAGSPGAGKTEFSKNLIELLGKDTHRIIRIDGDEIREFFPDYSGTNSFLFQKSISLIVDKIHDLALSQKQNFLMDGTLSNYDKARQNIQRSLKRERTVLVFYLYQKPEIAWKFTMEREIVEGRNIPQEAFVDKFLAAQSNVERILEEFGAKISVFLVKKNFETNKVENVIELEPNERPIDEYIEKRYTKNELEELL